MNHRICIIIRAISCLMVVSILTSCAVSGRDVPPEKILEDTDTILVLPFQNLYEVYGDKVHIDCDFCNRRHVVAEMPEGVADFMTEHLKTLLMNDKAYRFVFHEHTDGLLSHLEADENGVVKMTELVASFQASQDLDVILMGYLFHFNERVGTPYSVESPASVSFSLFLMRVSDRRILWRGKFEETQQALSENLLKIGSFFKRKGRWITARELAAEGLENLMETFPKP